MPSGDFVYQTIIRNTVSYFPALPSKDICTRSDFSEVFHFVNFLVVVWKKSTPIKAIGDGHIGVEATPNYVNSRP